MSIPSYDDTREFSGGLPVKGWHDFSLTEGIVKDSSSGNEMIVFTFVCDAGDSLGFEIKDYLVVEGEHKSFGFGKAKAIAKGAGWRWPDGLKGNKAFCAAFIQDPPLRVSLLIDHGFSYQDEDDNWINCNEETWEAWDGKKSKKAVISKYGMPRNPAEWQPNQSVSGTGSFDADDPPF